MNVGKPEYPHAFGGIGATATEPQSRDNNIDKAAQSRRIATTGDKSPTGVYIDVHDQGSQMLRDARLRYHSDIAS